MHGGSAGVGMEKAEEVRDLEGRVRRQVEQILTEIRGTVPAAVRPGEFLTSEDIVTATARVVVPSLLVDLPLEIERTVRGEEDRSDGERVEFLRLIISRLSAEWADLAGRLVGRLAEVVEASAGPDAVASLRESAGGRFREARSWAVLMGGPLPEAAGARRVEAPPVAVVEDLAEKIAEKVARRVEAGRVEGAPVPSDLAERVAAATADHLKAGVFRDLRRELAEIQDVSARTEAIRAVLRSELERALGAMTQSAFRPDEIRTIAAQIAHTLGGTLTNWIFGPPRPEGKGSVRRSSRLRRAGERRRTLPARLSRASRRKVVRRAARVAARRRKRGAAAVRWATRRRKGRRASVPPRPKAAPPRKAVPRTRRAVKVAPANRPKAGKPPVRRPVRRVLRRRAVIHGRR